MASVIANICQREENVKSSEKLLNQYIIGSTHFHYFMVMPLCITNANNNYSELLFLITIRS